MKGIIQFSLNNKFAIWILTLMVSIGGLYAGMNMKMETLPDIEVPIISVTTIYPGAAPEEVLDNITKPMEQNTRNLDGVTTIRSSSFESASNVIIEYNYDKNMQDALNEAREAIAGIPMPAGSQEPDISRISLNAFPIMSLSVSGDMPFDELTQLTETQMIPELKGLDGVASIQISGQQVNRVELSFDQQEMARLGLDAEQVKGIIQASSLSAPLGIFEFGETEKAVMVDGNIHTLSDLEQLQIPLIPKQPQGQQPGAGQAPASPPAASPQAGAEAENGQAGNPAVSGLPTISLSEIADIQVTGELESISRTNGMDSIGVMIVKSPDANTVEVVHDVKDWMEQFQSNDADVQLTSIYDQGEPIEKSVNTMLNKALLGSLFAILIIMLFLRNLRSTMIAVISIPLSILIALLILNQMDITLNIMTLGAMTVAIGRVVDDSIVVIENIYRRMSFSNEKLKGKALMMEATREMFVPIMASTVVTIAVFLPLGLVDGPIGEIFMPFALTIVFALLASLLVAITVVPMLAHALFRKGLKKVRHEEEGQGRLTAAYKKSLNWSLNHKLISFLLALVLLVSSVVVLTPAIGFSFLPAEEDKMMMVTYNPAPGEKKEDIVDMTLRAEEMLLARDGVDTMQYSVGGQNPMNPGATKQALFFVSYLDDFAAFEEEKETVLSALRDMGGQGEWKQQDMTGGGVGGDQMTLNIYGDKMEDLKQVVTQVTGVMEEEGQFANIDSSLSNAYDQYQLVANQAKLSQYGLTAGQVAMALAPVREQPVLTTINKDGQTLNVVMKVEKKAYADRTALEQVQLASPLGMMVPLGEVVDIAEGETADTLTRLDERIYVEVTADVTTSNVGKASSELETALDALELPDGVEISFGGVTEQMNESFRQLGLAMLAAVAIVYFILVLTFGGGLTPLAILFSLPFTVIGGLVGLYLAGETISVTALIGALMLIGIVVTNAIVLIDRVIQKQKEGLTVREALLEAAGTRLRPILMTALATIGALLPLALGFESGGLISKGLGVTVIGGLTSSTLLTLIIVPVVYEFLSKFRRKTRSTEL
ncbi:efflux RND transporter permease subunit [Marinicrinis sediminis]|uniref:Efflux RND transporter permease subunit n=1 Tax=Marinicrinis sediminis TaxID=1652465 RepID=A0ABW5RGC6_9BACL